MLVTKDDGIAWVSLNRPAVRNAINQQMQDELHCGLARLPLRQRRALCRADRRRQAFCTGIDRARGGLRRKQRRRWPPATTPATRPRGCTTTRAGHRARRACDCWKPVIAAVHGMACGGAFYMLGEVEFIIASDDATFFDPHVTYGMTAAFEPIQMLARCRSRRSCGCRCSASDERMTAERAREIGLVTEVVPRDELRERAALGGAGDRRLAAVGDPGHHARAVDRAWSSRGTRPSSSPTSSPASVRTRTRSRRARTALTPASARSGASAEARTGASTARVETSKLFPEPPRVDGSGE